MSDRNCDKCVYHIGGACSKWKCQMETLKEYDVRIRADERRKVEVIMRELYNSKNERGKHYIKEYMRDVLERLNGV